MGVENNNSNNRLSSNPTETTAQKGIIALLQTELPLVDKQAFSALKPEVQNALEKLIRKVLEKGNKADKEKLEDRLLEKMPTKVEEVKSLYLLFEKTKENAIEKEVQMEVTKNKKAVVNESELKNWDIQAQKNSIDQFQSAYPTLFAKYFPNGLDASKLDAAQLLEVKNKVGAMLSELVAQAKQTQKPQDIANAEKFLESFAGAGLVDDRKYVELKKEIEDLKRGMNMVPTPKGIALPDGKGYTKIGDSYMRFAGDGSVTTLKEQDGIVKKEMTNAAGFKVEVPMDADNKKDELLKQYAKLGEQAYYLDVLKKGEKALWEIEQEIEKCKKSNTPQDAQKVEQLEKNAQEIRTQTESLRAMFDIGKQKTTAEALKIAEELIAKNKAQLQDIEWQLQSVPATTDAHELQAKNTLKVVEDLGLTFLSNQNSHLLLQAMADREGIKIEDGISTDEKNRLARAFAALVGVDVKKLYPDFWADNNFKTMPPYIFDGMEMNRDEYLRRTVSKALNMSAMQLLTDSLDYKVVAEALERKTGKEIDAELDLI